MKDDFFQKRLHDLAAQSERTNRFTFTAFLTEAELAEYRAAERTLSAVGCTVWGGRADADRVMIRFGDPEQLGYEEAFPIVCLHIAPIQAKFADALTHRDFLGAVMHLGIVRGEIGDILVDEKSAYLFCTSNMAEYICRNLTRVRHTAVTCTVTEALPETVAERCEEGTVQVSSARLDGVIAKVYRISRSDCLALFHAKRVFVNGACSENHSYLLKENDKISVRGCGKFRYLGIGGQTRKDNLLIRYEKFI